MSLFGKTVEAGVTTLEPEPSAKTAKYTLHVYLSVGDDSWEVQVDSMPPIAPDQSLLGVLDVVDGETVVFNLRHVTMLRLEAN